MEVTQILMAVVIFCMMLGMGAAVKWADAKEQFTRPYPVLVGFISQYAFMPFITWMLGSFLVGTGGQFTGKMAYGLLLTGCMPGGTTSNLFCYFCGGDIGLSLLMTVTSTLLAFVMTPVMLSIYGPTFTSEEAQLDKANGTITLTLFLVLIPAAYGMWQRNRGEEGQAQADLLENIASKVGVLFIIAAVVLGLVENSHLLTSSWEVWAASLLPIPLGMLFGYAAGRPLLGCVSSKDKLIPNLKTIMLETGVQNSTLAVTIVTLSWGLTGDPGQEIATVPLLYSLGVVLEGVVATLLMKYFWINVPESSDEINLASA